MAERLLQPILDHAGQLALFGVVLVTIEWLWPLHRRRRSLREQTSLDVLYSFLLVASTPLFIAAPVSIADGGMTLLGGPLLRGRAWTQGLAPALQVLLAVAVIDLVGYWRHRLMHSRLLWPVHAVHHCSPQLDWLSTDRFHLLNHAITVSFNTIVLLLLFDPRVALASMIIRRFYGMFIHCNVRCSYGPLNRVLVSPLVHHWHHSLAQAAYDKNFASIFSLFDWLFGTLYLPDDGGFPEQVGIREPIEHTLWQHQAFPFRAWLARRRPAPAAEVAFAAPMAERTAHATAASDRMDAEA